MQKSGNNDVLVKVANTDAKHKIKSPKIIQYLISKTTSIYCKQFLSLR